MHKVGILNFTRILSSGGGFHYIMSILEGLENDDDFEVYIYYDDPEYRNQIKPIPNFKYLFIPEKENIFSKIIRILASYFEIRSPLLGKFNILIENKIDIFISFGSTLPFHLNIPFISFIGDVMYRHFPNLPEYSLKERIVRDISNKKLIKYSKYVVVDSLESAEDLTKFFKMKSKKFISIPLCAPPHIYKYKNISIEKVNEISEKYSLPENFIFYPAQFWSHKNHKRLLNAIYLIKQKHKIIINAVFTGATWESYNNVIMHIKELGLKEQIKCLGYLPEEDIVAIYKKATSLVFPSFAEYTNIPVVEAMVIGTPIVCSNTFSMPEQINNAGLLFDPFNEEDIAQKILKIWTNKNLRLELVENGYKRANELSDINFYFNWKETIYKGIQK